MVSKVLESVYGLIVYHAEQIIGDVQAADTAFALWKSFNFGS